MATSPASVIFEEPRTISLEDVSSSRTGTDLEAQKAGLRARPPGFRRMSRTSTSISSQTSPTLEGETVLYKVEDNALHGYPKLAAFLGRHDGYAVYKRFAALNARNLLYHQAKLIRLEHELHDLEQSLAHEKRIHYSVSYIFGEDAGVAGLILQKKYEKVSAALEKYNALLLEQKRIHELPRPDKTVVDAVHNYILSNKTEEPKWLAHPENTIYAVYDDDREPVQDDLIVLNPEYTTCDPFTRFMTTTGIDWWHSMYSRCRTPDGEVGEYVYQEKSVTRVMGVITMVVASALPTASIIALYFIESVIWRLIFIVVFSALFALALGLFTEARRIDIFAACAALASVQVVFVGTAFGNGPGN